MVVPVEGVGDLECGVQVLVRDVMPAEQGGEPSRVGGDRAQVGGDLAGIWLDDREELGGGAEILQLDREDGVAGALSPAGTRAGAKPTSQRTGRSTAESARSA